MLTNGEKLGAFIVPTGVGASIGGFAGDASQAARELSKYCKLIVNPNVVNAACFSGINDNMLYVEGYSLDEFFRGKCNLDLAHPSVPPVEKGGKCTLEWLHPSAPPVEKGGKCNLVPSINNKIGVVFDKSIAQKVLNVHINTINAIKTVYGIEVIGYEVTKEPVGVEFFIDTSGSSTGNVRNLDTIKSSAEKLISAGAEAIAIVCAFPDDDNDDYANGIGADPVGGVEAIISHYISKELKVPCAHAPAFENIQISTDIVDPRCSAEYITPTFLPCILIGLSQAPKLSTKNGISVDELDFLVMPYNSLGSVPVFEMIKRGKPVYAVKENKTVLNVTKKK